MRAIAFLGALQALDEAGALTTVEGYGGTSAGGIEAAGLALGYTPAELIDRVMTTDFARFKQRGGAPTTGDRRVASIADAMHRLATNLLMSHGFVDGDALTRWFGELIRDSRWGAGNAELTFGELERRRASSRRWRPGDAEWAPSLVLTGTRVLRHRAVYFSCVRHADMPIRDALRITVSVPYYFTAPLYRGEPYVDGGVIDNFPMHVFPMRLALGLLLYDALRDEMADGGGDDDDDDDRQAQATAAAAAASQGELRHASPFGALPLSDFTMHLINAPLDENTRLRIAAMPSDVVAERVLSVDAGSDVGFLELSADVHKRNALIERGRRDALAYLHRRRRSSDAQHQL